MKSKKVLIIILFSLIAFAGCDKGLKYNRIEIEKYPTKMVYNVGIDTELNLSDGKIRLTTISGQYDIFNIVQFDSNGNGEFDINHSIDFTSEGKYIVDICRSPDFCVSITIEVIDLN